MVGILNHDENVYNIIKPQSPLQPKPPRYESKCLRTIRKEFKEGKHAHLTMGEAEATLPEPDQFLRKKTREIKFMQRAKSARGHRQPPAPDQVPRKPTVPRVTDHVATPMRHRKNFLAKNAVDVMIASPPKQNDPQFVDSQGGNTQSLVQSGMVPVYTTQKKFGRVPSYLVRYKKEKEQEESRVEEERRLEYQRLENMKLSDIERSSIIEGLRTNWSEIHFQYQKLSLLTDTLPKKIRREQIESQLDELEKFLNLIENHPIIIVSDNPYLML